MAPARAARRRSPAVSKSRLSARIREFAGIRTPMRPGSAFSARTVLADQGTQLMVTAVVPALVLSKAAVARMVTIFAGSSEG